MEPSTEVAMKGRIVMVTGASDGIGKVTARELARKGAQVVMVCRNPQKAEAALAEVQTQSGNPSVELMLADLSSQSSIRALAKSFRERHDRLHVLVNNAGAIHQTRKMTDEGLEMTFATNHLGYFLLTELLLDVLKASAPARIVNVASTAHRRALRIPFDDLHAEKDFGPMKAYAESKLANILFTYELAKRLQGTRVTANCLHPGVVATGFGKADPGWFRIAVKLASVFFISAEKGAATSIYLASSPEVEGVTGKYFVRCAPASSSRASYDQAAAKRLWEVSERLTRSQPENTALAQPGA
jgi:NAD(P)-dependent dehydrogenase (short-subunit alcohol dehydrogenase family)